MLQGLIRRQKTRIYVSLPMTLTTAREVNVSWQGMELGQLHTSRVLSSETEHDLRRGGCRGICSTRTMRALDGDKYPSIFNYFGWVRCPQEQCLFSNRLHWDNFGVDHSVCRQQSR
jgi:hypothetical protein